MNKLPFASLLTVSVFMCQAAARAFSVETTAIIEGTVEDSCGALVVGVQVTVTNEQTGEAESSTTGTFGRFVLHNLQVGTCNLTKERAGSKKAVQIGIPP